MRTVGMVIGTRFCTYVHVFLVAALSMIWAKTSNSREALWDLTIGERLAYQRRSILMRRRQTGKGFPGCRSLDGLILGISSRGGREMERLDGMLEVNRWANCKMDRYIGLFCSRLRDYEALEIESVYWLLLWIRMGEVWIHTPELKAENKLIERLSHYGAKDLKKK